MCLILPIIFVNLTINCGAVCEVLMSEETIVRETFINQFPREEKLMLTSVFGGAVAFIVAGVVIANTVVSPSSPVGEGFKISVGEGSGLTNEALSDSAMWVGYNDVFTAGETLSTVGSVGDVYEFVSDDYNVFLPKLATSLNVEGNINSHYYDYGDGFGFTERWWGFASDDGTIDYTQPNISVYGDENGGSTSWSYSKGWDYSGWDYVDGGWGASEPFEGIGGDAIEPARSVMDEYILTDYSEEDALRVVENVIQGLGYSVDDFNIVVSTDWGLTVNAEMLLDGSPTPIVSNFFFTNEGLESAYGFSGSFVKQGNFDTVSPAAAVERLSNYSYRSWAAGSLYTKHYDNVMFTERDMMMDDSVSSDFGDNIMSDVPVSSDDDSMVAYGLFVSYIDGVEPTVNSDGVIKGFENVPNSDVFILGEQFFDNMWLVSFPEKKTEEETFQIIDILWSSGMFNMVDGDWMFSVDPIIDEPFMEPETREIVITEYETVWVIIYDVDGKVFITPGYILSNPTVDYAVYTVTSVTDDVLNIVDYTKPGIGATIEPYFD